MHRWLLAFHLDNGLQVGGRQVSSKRVQLYSNPPYRGCAYPSLCQPHNPSSIADQGHQIPVGTCSDGLMKKQRQARLCKNGNWINEQLQSALAAVDDGVGIKKAASRNHIPYSSLRDWCYSKTCPRDQDMKGVLTLVEEEQLVQYLLQMCDRDLGLLPTQMKMKVYEITKN